MREIKKNRRDRASDLIRTPKVTLDTIYYSSRRGSVPLAAQPSVTAVDAPARMRVRKKEEGKRAVCQG